MTRTVPVTSSTETTIAGADEFAGSYCNTYHKRAAGLKLMSRRNFGSGLFLPLTVTTLNLAVLPNAAACASSELNRGGAVVPSTAAGAGTGTIERVIWLEACAL